MKAPRTPSKWTNREIEADSAGYVAAQEAHREDQEASARQRQEADDEARYTAEYISNGGRERDAAAAYRKHRNRLAAQAAGEAEQAAARDTRTRIRQKL